MDTPNLPSSSSQPNNQEESKSSLEKEIEESQEVELTECAYVNPWARPLDKWYQVAGPLDQGRIIASDAPPGRSKVQRRVNALKKLVRRNNIIGKMFFTELTKLERKYNLIQLPLYEARSRIVNGLIPENLLEPGLEFGREEDATIVGVPGFWLTCLQNDPYIVNMLESYDLPVLSYITDMKPLYSYKTFGVQFDFAANPYFTNSELTVTFTCKYSTSNKCFAGVVLTGCAGCRINWRRGQNVTIRRKKLKGRFKKVHRPSFFQMFQLPCLNESKIMTSSEEIAIRLGYGDVVLYLLDRMIPRAVLYYTKEALNSEVEEVLKKGYHVASGYKGYVSFFKCSLL